MRLMKKNIDLIRSNGLISFPEIFTCILNKLFIKSWTVFGFIK